jgi:hypothetical protein
MSHSALNGEQFHDHVHPHQLALPGMEHLAHPWAGPLSRGYMLGFESSASEHHLRAVDVSHPKYPTEAAELDWKRKKSQHPGEVAMVINLQGSYGVDKAERARGLAPALFHSAHYFNFGQETVPIHSPLRSEEGEHFANKVRPDLKPDVWHNYVTGVEQRQAGKPRGEPAAWEGVHYGLHPFERAEQAKQEQTRKKQSGKLQSRSSQGRLF